MRAPSFTLTDIQSNKKVSLDDFRGKPVMITFWASWCPDCQRDMPQKHALFEKVPEDKLAFLTINVTGREASADAGRKFVEKNNYHFPVLLDNGTETYDKYGCMSVPTTILLDEDHHIAASFNDQASYMDIFMALGQLID